MPYTPGQYSSGSQQKQGGYTPGMYSGAAPKQPESMSYNYEPSADGTQTIDPVAQGTGVKSRLSTAAEDFLDVATPLGSIVRLGTEGPFSGANRGFVPNALDIGNIGLSALPWLKGIGSPVSKAMLKGSVGAGAAVAAGDLAGVEDPYAKSALAIGGGLALGRMPNPETIVSPAVESTASKFFGKLSPGQGQVATGKLMSPEIEREALNRSSLPMQELAQKQGESLGNVVQGELGKVAPIQAPYQAAGNFQEKFQAAKETASKLMDELNDVVRTESKGVNHNVIGVELRDAWINRLKREGWKVDKLGKIIPDLTSPGYSEPAAKTIQAFLDEAPKVNNLQNITNFKRNFGNAIEKAFQEGGNYAQGVQKRLYGATKAAARTVTPDFAADTITKGNKAWSSISKLEELGPIDKALSKDPVKFYDTLLQGAANDKNFIAMLEKKLPATGLSMKDVQSVAVSNISDKFKTAMSASSRDEVDRVVGALTTLEKEIGKIPISARKALLGDSLPVLEDALKEGSKFKEWANRLRNAPETARNTQLQKFNKVANVVEFLTGRIPYVGKPVGGAIGLGIRKLGMGADEAAMRQYLESGTPAITAKAKVSPNMLNFARTSGAMGAIAATPDEKNKPRLNLPWLQPQRQ